MHQLARERLSETTNVRIVDADFKLKRDGWWSDLRTYDAVITIQAVHELRHKRHTVGLHRSVRRLLIPGGLYLVCDHVAGARGQSNTELYMTVGEQSEALATAGFEHVQIILEKGGLVLHHGRSARTWQPDRILESPQIRTAPTGPRTSGWITRDKRRRQLAPGRHNAIAVR